ncbi:Topoisomerase 1-associated factor 1 [Coemansia sp. RSA 2337]|nr:Topoisomerase 1-associated factor 1 [Coemansia sp. S3946]KAJ2071734.1 Topoisomerase 1-associated factor 1 [Coemansia sp. S155-1]KAJ2469683.1 Topoisomerase 1-associated factor 1 [Coemansia sp. RSA 2337]
MDYLQAEEEGLHHHLLGEEQLTDEQLSEEIERFRRIVLSACSSLGNLQLVTDSAQDLTERKMEYVPSEDCLASLKDIKRYIQEDEQGEGKWVLRWLGECNTLQNDIIPIFIYYTRQLKNQLSDHDHDRALKTIMMCVELLVFLTWSMDSEPEEVKVRFIRVLRSYKRAFASSPAVFSLLSIAVMYFRKPHKSDKEALLVKGILYVFRNVLAIPDPLVSPTSKGMSQVEVHDALIAVLDNELAIDFFLTLASSADDKQLKDLRPTLLDIVYYLFYRVPVSALFDQQMTWFNADNGSKRFGRHNNFGGVYAVSTGDSTIMPVFNAKEVLHPFANMFKKRQNVRKPKDPSEASVAPVDREWRILDPSSVPILRRVAAVFIDSCFNPFMSAMFEDARTSGTVMDASTPRLLYVAAYFVDISLTNPAVDLGCTSALVQTHVFGLVMRNASAFVEMREWMPLEQAMYCTQQILLSLGRMRGTKLDSLSENVLSNLFYDGDALDLFVRLCRVYKPTKHSRRFLEQVARLTETFLATLKSYAQAKAGLLVKKRVKKRAKKPVKTESDGEEARADTAQDPSAANKADNESDIGPDMDDAGDAEDEESGGEDNDDDGEVLVERAFDIAKFERAFATSDVVKAYSHLLAPPSSIEFVYPMLSRIAIASERPHLFFKKNIMLRMLVLFDDQYTYPHRTEMLDLVAWIFRQYITVINSPALTHHYKAEELNNKLAVECMLAFLKQSRLGTTVKPVITRHIVEIIADGGSKKDDDANDDELKGDVTVAVQEGVRIEGVRIEADDDDFDFDFDFGLPPMAASSANNNQLMDDVDMGEVYFNR